MKQKWTRKSFRKHYRKELELINEGQGKVLSITREHVFIGVKDTCYGIYLAVVLEALINPHLPMIFFPYERIVIWIHLLNMMNKSGIFL